MHRTILADTSVLIIFHKINEFELLEKVYKNITITPEVAGEFSGKLPSWILVQKVSDKKYQELIETQLDIGEASIIALSKEFSNSLILLDDLKARKVATALNVTFTGSLGIIYKAKQMGIIEIVKPIVQKISETNFRLSKKVINEFLKITDEL
jgi:predicted nucleic acid-binding protein